MIACHRAVEYLHEPFNPELPTGGAFGLDVPHWWLHVRPGNESPYLPAARRMVDLKPVLWSRLRGAADWGRRREILDKYRWLRRRRNEGARALIKDPIGFFSAEWLAERFGAQVVVVVRHPAAWVDSFLRRNWPQPRGGIRDQPDLYNGLLRPFRDILLGDEAAGRVDRSCTTWNMFMHVVGLYRRKHPDWVFVRHEDLSLDPLGGFESLYERLGLRLTPRCRDVILKHSAASEDEARYTQSSITRDSRVNLGRWRKDLRPQVVSRIRRLTEPFWPDHYGVEEW